MINTLLTAFDGVEDMAWTDRYGGLVRIAERTIQDRDGKNIKELFPVTSTVSEAECWENGRYKELGPNSRYKSVMYFEQLGPIAADEQNISRGRTLFNFSTKLRLVCWVNYKKLGMASTDNLGALKVEALKNICSYKNIPAQTIYNKIKVSEPAIDSRDETIKAFTRFTNCQDQKLFFYPYDVFSITFKLSWTSPVDCGEAVTPGAEIEC